MNTAIMKLWLQRILWMLPFISYLIYSIPIYIAEVSRHDVFFKNYGQVVKDDIPSKIQMPAISICSSNQYSYRDADNILKIPKWYDINYNYTKFMSIFRNFAHHKMDPNEIESFTQDQKNFLIEHRKAFTELLRKQVTHLNDLIKFKSFTNCMTFQVVPSCDELLLYCNVNGIQHNCSDLFKIRSSLDGICCTFEIEKVNQLIE